MKKQEYEEVDVVLSGLSNQVDVAHT
jgi:hypothetical protein